MFLSYFFFNQVSKSIVDKAIEMGVNFFDTAEVRHCVEIETQGAKEFVSVDTLFITFLVELLIFQSRSLSWVFWALMHLLYIIE